MTLYDQNNILHILVYVVLLHGQYYIAYRCPTDAITKRYWQEL